MKRGEAKQFSQSTAVAAEFIPLTRVRFILPPTASHAGWLLPQVFPIFTCRDSWANELLPSCARGTESGKLPSPTVRSVPCPGDPVRGRTRPVITRGTGLLSACVGATCDKSRASGTCPLDCVRLPTLFVGVNLCVLDISWANYPLCKRRGRPAFGVRPPPVSEFPGPDTLGGRSVQRAPALCQGRSHCRTKPGFPRAGRHERRAVDFVSRRLVA